MDVVVSSRHCEVSERFREHVEEKLTRLEKHDHRIIRVEVLVERERNARQPERQSQAERQIRVELTAKSKGPVLRAEASAEDKMAALDLALDKMSAQMRRAADRRKVHRGQHAPESVAQAMARTSNGVAVASEAAETEHEVGPVAMTGDGPLVVREKSRLDAAGLLRSIAELGATVAAIAMLPVSRLISLAKRSRFSLVGLYTLILASSRTTA